LSNKKISKAQLALQMLDEEILTESVEIYLPALKENVVIKPLKSVEELNIKTQNISFETFLRQINSVLLSKTHIKNVSLINYFKTVEEFESKILPIDRMLMIFGLVKNSFEKLADFPIECEGCGKSFISTPTTENLNFKFEIDKDTLVNTDYYDFKITKSYLDGKLEIDFGFTPEETRLKLLSKKSTKDVQEQVTETNQILDAVDNLIVFIKSIRIYKLDRRKKEGKKLISEINKEADGFEEIFEFIHNTPLKIKDTILGESNLDEMEKYSPIFKVVDACPYCGHLHEMDNSPEIEFFRKTLSLLT